MEFLSKYTGKEIFWELFPEYRETFSTIYNKKDIEGSSKVMWMLIHFISPKSRFRNATSQERKKAIESDFKTKLKWDSYLEEMNFLESLLLSKAKKYLYNWEKKLEERDEFMANIPYEAGTYDMLDKMMAATDKLWKQYRTALKDVQDEDELTSKGGATLSLGDSGQI